MRRTAPFALLVALGVACSEPSSNERRGRGVLLIAIESLRADHVSCYGYDRATTPALDELAGEGVRFDQTFSSAPWFLPAALSLISGCDPVASKRYLPPGVPASLLTTWNLADNAPHIAHEFLRGGYETAAFVDHPLLGRPFGFARGFQDFFDYDPEERSDQPSVGAPAVLSRLRHWLDQRDADSSWFAFVQLADLDRTWYEVDPVYDAHFTPRESLDWVPPTADAVRVFHAIPRRNWAGGLRTLGQYEAEYDGAILRLDAALARLFDELRSSPRWSSTSVCVVSTHGFGFGEAGLYLDNGTLADVDLRVPLIFKPAADVPCRRGSVSRSLASLLDVAPTLLALAGRPAPPEMQGLSLLDAFEDPLAAPRKFAFASCAYQEGASVIGPRYCYERSEPWNSDDPAIALSWSGGGPSNPREPREVLHDRSDPGGIGHGTSLELVSETVEPMREALRRWEEHVDRLRRKFHPSDWSEVELAPLPGEDP